MDNHVLKEAETFLEPTLCVIALATIYRRRQMANFGSLGCLLAVHLTAFVLVWPLIHFATRANAGKFYLIYFYMYWMDYAIEAILALYVVYDLYKLSMAPLRGLQRLGMLMFRWAAGIAIAVAMGMAFGPNVTASNFLIHFVSQLQQTQSILTLCLLLFVAMAIRPMGLSFGSRIFGVTLGLGILATTNLVCSAWLVVNSKSVHNAASILSGVSFAVTLCIWIGYFSLPEPKRRMIVLPTTSPFLRWNQISMALGDDPGFVAVGGIHPEILAPAELEIMRRASRKMSPVSIRG